MFSWFTDKDTLKKPLLEPEVPEPIKKLTTIATTQQEIDETIKAMMLNSNNTKRLIGLDTITQTKSRQITTSILQLYDGTHYLLVRLTHIRDIPESLYNFLSCPGYIYAGFAIKDTLARLEKEYGFVCKNFLEVGLSGWDYKLNPGRYHYDPNVVIPGRKLDTLTPIKSIYPLTNMIASRSLVAAFRIGERALPTGY